MSRLSAPSSLKSPALPTHQYRLPLLRPGKGRQILATPSARDRLGPEFQLRQLPSTKVKGKAKDVEVFEVGY